MPGSSEILAAIAALGGERDKVVPFHWNFSKGDVPLSQEARVKSIFLGADCGVMGIVVALDRATLRVSGDDLRVCTDEGRGVYINNKGRLKTSFTGYALNTTSFRWKAKPGEGLPDELTDETKSVFKQHFEITQNISRAILPEQFPWVYAPGMFNRLKQTAATMEDITNSPLRTLKQSTLASPRGWPVTH